MRKVMGAFLMAMLSGCVVAEEIAAPGEPPPPLAGARPLLGQPVLPTGYAGEVATHQLEDPRAIVFDAAGAVHVLEGAPAQLSRVLADGTLAPISMGGGNGAWTGAARIGDTFYVAEEGTDLGGRILAIGLDGAVTPLPASFPAGLIGPLAAGPDGALYLGIATLPEGAGRNIPCQDIRLGDGRIVPGGVPCTGAVLRLSPDGAEVAVHSWGYTNPTDLGFTPDGRLLVADDLPPVVAGDLVWAAAPGVWYGWPDYLGQTASADPQLAVLPNPPPPPLAEIEGQVAAVAMAQGAEFGGPSQMFIALAEPGQIGFTELQSGVTVPFADNLVRPSAMAFDPNGRGLYVADAGSGTLWRIEAFPQ